MKGTMEKSGVGHKLGHYTGNRMLLTTGHCNDKG